MASIDELWTAYMEAETALIPLVRTWNEICGDQFTLGATGLYGQLYAAQQAKENAWNAWNAARALAHPAPPTR
jgi:hypothetical protein